MSVLRSNKAITKFLISTPSRFVGESVSEQHILTHAYENHRLEIYTPNLNESSYRQYLELTISTPEYQWDTIIVPDYTHAAETYCILLSVLFGKRFDSHGLLLQHGRSYVPSLRFDIERYNKTLTFNSLNERCDFRLELNLQNFHKFMPILDAENERKKIIDSFLYAGKFYLNALREMETNPEVAFINLITSCEILAAHKNYDIDTLLDEELIMILKKIELGLDGGEKIVRQLKKRFSSIAEKFCLLITEHVDEDFFSTTESLDDNSRLKLEGFKARLKAAYNTRSKYVHAGKFMENWFSVNHLKQNEEVTSGNPVIQDRDMRQSVERSPTILGLERIVRYVLIKYLIKNQVINPF